MPWTRISVSLAAAQRIGASPRRPRTLRSLEIAVSGPDPDLSPPGHALGAAVVIGDPSGRVLLVRHNYGRRNWEVPVAPPSRGSRWRRRRSARRERNSESRRSMVVSRTSPSSGSEGGSSEGQADPDLLARRRLHRMRSRWVRWWSGARWSLWHRIDQHDTYIRVPGTIVVKVELHVLSHELPPRLRPSDRAARTTCGVQVPSGVPVQRKDEGDMPPDRCAYCSYRHLLRTLPPLGSPPSGGPRIVVRSAETRTGRRRRPQGAPASAPGVR